MNNLNYVSIGIPFYNAEATILDAVRSVLAQTHKNWELILINDGSTDRSLELVQSINDPRVRIYSDGKNRRLAARLNELVGLSKYDFIARMDADDMMTPNRIEELLKILCDNEKYDLASCGVYSIKDNGSFNGYRGNNESNYTFLGLLEKKQGFLHAGLVARKSWFERNRYNELLAVGEDTDLWLRTAKAGDFQAISIKEPLYFYREEGNVTLEKLLTAYRIERNNYVPLIDNNFTRMKYFHKSVAKTFIVKIMERTGTLKYLLHRRNKKNEDEQLLQAFNDSLAKIYSTKIPGVDYE